MNTTTDLGYPLVLHDEYSLLHHLLNHCTREMLRYMNTLNDWNVSSPQCKLDGAAIFVSLSLPSWIEYTE
jgi:hypothetical protein